MSWQSRFLLRGATGEPVGMDAASRGGDPVNKRLMAGDGILMPVDQLLEPFPAALGAVEVDHLKPVRPRVKKWSPALRIERDALHIAAAPFVDDRHAVSFDIVRIE